MLALAMLIALASSAYRGETEQLGCWPRWLRPTPGNGWFALAFVAVCCAATVAIGRGWLVRFRVLHLSMMLAFLTVVLGLASYLPLAKVDGEMHWVMLVAWVLGLFMGALPVMPGQSADGPAELYSLGYQIAAFSGIATVTVAAVSVIWQLLRDQSDRLAAILDVDIDIVVGIDDEALELVRHLKSERDQLRTIPGWFKTTWRERMELRWRRRRSSVVLVHNSPDEPRLGEFRSAGCRVIARESIRDALQARLLVTHGRPAVRHFFAVQERPADNLALVCHVGSILAQASSDKPAAFVPRLVARVDDPREARAVRLAHLSECGYYMDALSADELLARDIVARIVRQERSMVLLLGDSALTVAILDEIVLRRAFAHECHRGFPIREAVLIDAHAKAQVDEWLQHCPPATCRPTPFTIRSFRGRDWDRACSRLLQDREDDGAGTAAAIVVTGTPSSQLSAQAMRISGAHEGALVFCPSDSTMGVEDPPLDVGTYLPGRLVVSYGSTLLANGEVPEDSWTVLARQNHAAFLVGKDPYPIATRREWGDAAWPEFVSEKFQGEGKVGSSTHLEARLPRFIRDDNLHQQRKVMQLVAEEHGGWLPVTASDHRAEMTDEQLSEHLLDSVAIRQIAKGEHERWCVNRLAAGWRFLPTSGGTGDKADMEWNRFTANLWDWDDEKTTDTDRDYDIEQVTAILKRLFLFGIAPKG